MQDLVGTLLSLFVFPTLLVPGGYVAAWLADAFSFRSRRLLSQLAVAALVGIATVPILTYLVLRYLGGWNAAWITTVLMGAAMIYLMLVQARRSTLNEWVKLPAGLRSALFVALIWVCLGILLQIDFQLGDRVYFPYTGLGDLSFRVFLTDALSRVGAPLSNPFYFPGHPVPLAYYYFGYLIPAQIESLGQTSLGPRGPYFATVVWTGLLLLALIALYLQLTPSHWRIDFRKRFALFSGLMLVSGLDLIMIFLGAAVVQRFPDITDRWQEEGGVPGWLVQLTWAPHHVMGFVACMVALLLLREMPRVANRRKELMTAILVGMAFASAIGLSVWLPIVAAGFCAVWFVYSAFNRDWQTLRVLTLSGMIGGVLILPFLFETLALNPARQAFIVPDVKWFGPATTLFERLSKIGQTISPRRQRFVYLLLLPLNYFLELGYVLLAGCFYWLQRVCNRLSIGRAEMFDLLLALTSFLMCTFLRSNILTNDLAWRGIMLFCFVLVAWATEFTIGFFRDLRRGLGTSSVGLGPRMRRVMIGLLLVGSAAFLYDIVIVRVFPVFFSVPQLGERTFAMRQLYAKLNGDLPPTAIFQHNPTAVSFGAGVDYFHGLYGNHQLAVSDFLLNLSLRLGPEYDRIRLQAIDLFMVTKPNSENDARQFCQQYKVTALIFKDTDGVWQNRSNWIWQRRPYFANSFGRVFLCSDLSSL